MTYHIYGIGNALVDTVIEATEDDLASLGIEKGIMTLIDEDQLKTILAHFSDREQTRACGGSAANTIIGATQYGASCFYSSKVADDESGHFYLEDLFKLLYLTFTDLRIQQNHVDRFKEEKIDGIKIDEKIPKTKFYKDLMNKFYQNHNRTIYPSVDYIQQINLKDVREFYKDRFQNSGDFIFTIVGDFDFEQIEPLISKYIGSLEFKNKKDKFIDHNIRTNLKSEKITYKEDNPVKASYGRFYNKKFNNTPIERYKAELLSLIIDKLFFDEIREENKLVYSIFISEYFNQKFPIELYSFYLGYEADPKNIELINSKIEQILNKIKT